MTSLITCLRQCLAEIRQEAELAAVHLLRPAQGAPTPACVGVVPASVFELGQRGLSMRWKADQAREEVALVHRWVRIVTRGEGLVRCQAVPFTETAAGLEREQQRRARQILPRPPRQKFKMKGTKAWSESQS